MRYTIKTASWGNEDKSSAIINTKEVGHKAVSKVDTPEAWEALQEWIASGGKVRSLEEGSAYKTARAGLK